MTFAQRPFQTGLFSDKNLRFIYPLLDFYLDRNLYSKNVLGIREYQMEKRLLTL